VMAIHRQVRMRGPFTGRKVAIGEAPRAYRRTALGAGHKDDRQLPGDTGV